MSNSRRDTTKYHQKSDTAEKDDNATAAKHNRIFFHRPPERMWHASVTHRGIIPILHTTTEIAVPNTGWHPLDT